MPSISANGRLLFESRTDSADIWEANPAKPASAMHRLTNDRARNLRPSISADGSKLAYVSDRTGNFDAWVKDLVNGTDAVVAQYANARNLRGDFFVTEARLLPGIVRHLHHFHPGGTPRPL
jgi:Tol biopolymer transport system component